MPPRAGWIIIGPIQKNTLRSYEPVITPFCREHEVVFIPQKVADRLREYAANSCQASGDRIFPISYETARMILAKASKKNRDSKTSVSRFERQQPTKRATIISLSDGHL